MAENYLVRVLQKNSTFHTFNQLRYYHHFHTPTRDLETLPPTFASISLHILRAFFVTYLQVNCLNENITPLDPRFFGYEVQHDYMVPKKVHILLPPINEFVPSCHCQACISEKSCICVRAGIGCCEYCSCQIKKNVGIKIT